MRRSGKPDLRAPLPTLRRYETICTFRGPPWADSVPKNSGRERPMLRHLVWSLLLAAVANAAHAQNADTILLNGKIITLDARSSVVQALAIRDGRIVAVGTNDDIKKLAGSSTRTVDVGGRTVVPGLIDSHIHALRAGLTYS